MLIMRRKGREKRRGASSLLRVFTLCFFVCLSKPSAPVEGTLLIVMMGNMGISLP